MVAVIQRLRAFVAMWRYTRAARRQERSQTFGNERLLDRVEALYKAHDDPRF